MRWRDGRCWRADAIEKLEVGGGHGETVEGDAVRPIGANGVVRGDLGFLAVAGDFAKRRLMGSAWLSFCAKPRDLSLDEGADG